MDAADITSFYGSISLQDLVYHLYCPKDGSLVVKTKNGSFHCSRCNVDFDCIEVYQNQKSIFIDGTKINKLTLKDALNDIFITFQPVDELGLEQSSLDNSKVSDFYKRALSPNIERFIKKYRASPEKYLDNCVKAYLDSTGRSEEFYTVSCSCDYDNKLTGGVSVNVIRRGLGPSAYFAPYIYVWSGSSNNEILSFGFDYGNGVKKDDPSVKIVKTDKQLRSLVYNLPRKNKHILVGENKGKDVFFKYIDVEEIGDFVDRWNNNYSLSGDFDHNEIPENIDMVIAGALDDLWPLLEKTSKICLESKNNHSR